MEYPAAALSMANSPQASAMGVIVMLVLMISLTMIFILAYNFIMNITLARVNVNLDALHAGWDAASLEESHSPLRRLERNADLIVSTVKDMTEKQYKDQLAITESQMKSLQAQIKPHFLYNTLDAMKWLGVAHQAPEVAALATDLADILRFSISGEELVTLERELELLDRYLDIQLIRFEDRFTCEIDAADRLQSCLVPKLALQPLVENAIIHGVADRDDGYIKVQAVQEGDDLVLRLSDNGCGMTEEELEEKLHMLDGLPVADILVCIIRIVSFVCGLGRPMGSRPGLSPGRAAA